MKVTWRLHASLAIAYIWVAVVMPEYTVFFFPYFLVLRLVVWVFFFSQTKAIDTVFHS